MKDAHQVLCVARGRIENRIAAARTHVEKTADCSVVAANHEDGAIGRMTVRPKITQGQRSFLFSLEDLLVRIQGRVDVVRGGPGAASYPIAERSVS